MMPEMRSICPTIPARSSRAGSPGGRRSSRYSARPEMMLSGVPGQPRATSLQMLLGAPYAIGSILRMIPNSLGNGLFFAVGFGASALRAWLTSPVRLWTQRGSGALMLVYAAFLALQLI